MNIETSLLYNPSLRVQITEQAASTFEDEEIRDLPSQASAPSIVVNKGNYDGSSKAMECRALKMLLSLLTSEKSAFIESFPSSKERFEATKNFLFHVKYDFVVDGDVSLGPVFELPEFTNTVGLIYRDVSHLAKNIWKSVNNTYRVFFDDSEQNLFLFSTHTERNFKALEASIYP